MSVRNVLDLLRAHFGTDVTAELAESVAGVPTPRVNELFEHYVELAAVEQQIKPQHTLRPYIYMPQRMNGMLIGPKPPGTLSLNEMRQLLLYCHSLAFEDRLGHAIYRECFDSSAPFLVSVAGVIGYYARLSRLIDDAVIIPLTFDPAERWRNLKTPQSYLERSKRIGEIAHQLFPTEGLRDFMGGVAFEAHSDVDDALSGADRFPDKADIWLYDRQYLDVLRRVLADPHDSGTASLPPGVALEHQVDLLSMHIPRIRDLADSDLIAIRRGEGVFAAWRTALSDGLRAMAVSRQSGLGDPREALATAVGEQLEGLRAQSSTMNTAWFAPTLTDLAVGALGTSIAAAAFGTAGAAAGLVAGAASTIAQGVIKANSQRHLRAAGEALSSHIAVVSELSDSA